MKVYKVKVNGKVYEVELEAVEERTGSIEVKQEVKKEVVSEGSNEILAPIAGKVLEVKVNVGDIVSKGQTVAIVEAMKLMNEIESEFDGRIVEVFVKDGDSVDYGKPLFRIV